LFFFSLLNRFNESVDFDKLPPLTPEYFFSFFQPVMDVLKLSIKSARFLKDWSEHILPQQELARKQAKQGELVHKSSQGRPKTVMPLWEEVKIPAELLRDKSLLVMPAGNDVPPHMFPKKRKTKYVNQYGHYENFYFSSFVVIAGPQIRYTIIEKYGFDNTETEVMNQLVKQYDKKLAEEIKNNKRSADEAAAAQSSPGIAINWDDVSSDESEDEEERKRKCKERKEEKKAKRVKPVEGGLSTCDALGVVFDAESPNHPFSHMQNFVRDKELFEYILSCLGSNNNVYVSSAF
jgi:hypothetical protein